MTNLPAISAGNLYSAIDSIRASRRDGCMWEIPNFIAVGIHPSGTIYGGQFPGFGGAGDV